MFVYISETLELPNEKNPSKGPLFLRITLMGWHLSSAEARGPSLRALNARSILGLRQTLLTANLKP